MNANKIVRGSEIDDEFDKIQTAVNSKADSASPTLTGTVTIGGVALTSTTAELNILDGVTSTAAELNILDGVTSTTAELNILDGVTATATELNYVDGVTSAIQTQLDAKAATAAPTFTGAVTFSGSVTLNGEVIEQTGTMPAGTTPAIDPTNGVIQEWTLSGNSTPTDSIADGEYVTLLIDDGTSYTITWPTMEWIGGSAPTLDTTNTNVIEMWKVGSTLYGASVGVAS